MCYWRLRDFGLWLLRVDLLRRWRCTGISGRAADCAIHKELYIQFNSVLLTADNSLAIQFTERMKGYFTTMATDLIYVVFCTFTWTLLKRVFLFLNISSVPHFKLSNFVPKNPSKIIFKLSNKIGANINW